MTGRRTERAPEPGRRMQVVVLAIIAVVMLSLAAILLIRPASLDVSQALYKDKKRFRPEPSRLIIDPLRVRGIR